MQFTQEKNDDHNEKTFKWAKFLENMPELFYLVTNQFKMGPFYKRHIKKLNYFCILLGKLFHSFTILYKSMFLSMVVLAYFFLNDLLSKSFSK